MSRSTPASSWSQIANRLKTHSANGDLLDELLERRVTEIPEGFRKNRGKSPDAYDEEGPYSHRAFAAMTNYDVLTKVNARQLRLERNSTEAAMMRPAKEWERVVEMATKLRDEMIDSGKFPSAVLMNLQAMIALVADPTTRPVDRAAAVDRIFRMSEALERPLDQTKSDEKEIEKKPTFELLKSLKKDGTGS